MTDVNFSLSLRTSSEENILTSEKENYRSMEKLYNVELHNFELFVKCLAN